MVIIFACSDTLQRKWEQEDSSLWDNETRKKIGICYGSLIVIDGPLGSGEEMTRIMMQELQLTDNFIDPKQRKNIAYLPGAVQASCMNATRTLLTTCTIVLQTSYCKKINPLL